MKAFCHCRTVHTRVQDEEWKDVAVFHAKGICQAIHRLHCTVGRAVALRKRKSSFAREILSERPYFLYLFVRVFFCLEWK